MYNFSEKQKDSFFIVCLLSTFTLFFFEAAVFVIYRELWVDELFAIFRSFLFLKGELIPFQNGVFPYPPFVILTHGVPQLFFGPSLYIGRIVSALFFALLLTLLYKVAWRLSGRSGALLGVALILSNFLLSANYVSATLYSLVAFLLVAIVWLEISLLTPRKKIVFIAALSALLFLARTNMIVVPMIYALYLLFQRTAIRQLLLFAAVFLLIVGVGYLPIILFNPSLALAHLLSPFAHFGPLAGIPFSIKEGGHGIARFLEVFTALLKEYYGFLLLFFAVSFLVASQHGKNITKFLRDERGFTISIFLSSGLLAAHYFHPRIVGNVYYAGYFVPLMVLVIVTGISRFFRENRFAYTVLAGVLILNFSSNFYRTDVVSHPREETDIERILRGAAFLQKHTKPEDKIIAFDNSLFHIFAADRRTFFPLLNRDFLFLGDADTAKVKNLGFYNLEMVRDWALNDAQYLILHEERWPSSFLRLPFWGKGTEDVQARIDEIQLILRERYKVVGRIRNVYPRKYTEGNDGGTLVIYRRTSSVSAVLKK